MQGLKKEQQNLENAALKLLSLALKAGAQQAEVCGSYSQKKKLTLEKQDYHMASSDDGYQLGLRVLIGQKQGFAACNSIEPAELKAVSQLGVEIANLSPDNPYYEIFPSQNVPTEAHADLWDEPLHNLSLQTQKEWIKLLAEEALKDPRFRLNEGSVSIGSGLFVVINSHGTHKVERETRASWGLMGMAVDGERITSFDYFEQISRKASGVPDRIVASADKFRTGVIKNLIQGSTQSYKGLVAFSPRAVINIFLSPLIHQLNGRSVVEGTSKWKLADQDRSVLNADLTIKDLPWLADRQGCTFFDREGTPTQNMVAFENGVLKNFFFDHYAAKALNRKSTGHAAAPPTAPPVISPHCLSVAGGKTPLATLMDETTTRQKDFLLVHRYSGQTDPITGDFSGVAKGGEWWHAGERAYFVNETLISGNLFETLGSGLVGLSKETEVIDDAEESPTLVAEGISVTAPKK